MGGTNALLELRDSLKAAGLDLPYWEHVCGFDTNIHVAVLSKFPFAARRPHTNDNFLLSGRRFRVSRGFSEVDIQVNANYSFTVLGAHLKSRRPVPQGSGRSISPDGSCSLRRTSLHPRGPTCQWPARTTPWLLLVPTGISVCSSDKTHLLESLSELIRRHG